MLQTVLSFWFEDIEPSQWWKKDIAFDELIKERFGRLHQQAVHCELYQWRMTAKGRLAEIIVLDQFSRNIFRNSPLAFSNDSLALALSQEAVSAKADRELSAVENSFLYMPYMHSESLVIHDIALELFDKSGIEANYKFEVKHRDIIEKYGRYPHRNNIFGRASTPEELEFLKAPDSSF